MLRAATFHRALLAIPRRQAPVRLQLDSRDQARRLPAYGPARPRGRNEARAFLFAFDLLELDGLDMRREPIETRKATLASLLRKCKPWGWV
jgi:hypothetical protein